MEDNKAEQLSSAEADSDKPSYLVWNTRQTLQILSCLLFFRLIQHTANSLMFLPQNHHKALISCRNSSPQVLACLSSAFS